MNRLLFLPIVLCVLLVSCSRVESKFQPVATIPSPQVTTDQRASPITYTVQSGDNLFSLADKFKLHAETILWANFDLLADNPNRLQPDMLLIILPVDGIYYTWRIGDNPEAVAGRFGVKPEDIVNWPGNQLDRASFQNGVQPNIQPGTQIIVPGGTRVISK